MFFHFFAQGEGRYRTLNRAARKSRTGQATTLRAKKRGEMKDRQKYSSTLMHVPHTSFLLKTLHTSFSFHVILLPLLLLLYCFYCIYQLVLFSEVVSGTFKHDTGFSAHIHSLSDKSFLTANSNVSLFFIPHSNIAINWIRKAYGIYELTLQLLIGYVFYPHGEFLRGSQLLATKLASNEFVAYFGLCSTPSLQSN